MTYAARYSAFSPIEHLWAPMSKAMSGVILPSTLEEESTAPAKQGKLSEEERATKKRVVFNVLWRSAHNVGKTLTLTARK